MANTTLAAELKLQRAAVHADMTRAHGGEPERLVRTHVLFVADTNQALLEQLHDRREDLVSRQTLLRQVAIRSATNLRKHIGKRLQTIELRLVAMGAPRRMIAMLLAAFRVPPSCLQVTARV